MTLRRLLVVFAAAALTQAVAGADPVPLKITELGHGPTIVFVHATGGGRLDWMPTARKLIARHHVVLVDMPGTGDSPLPEPFSMEAVGDALDAVLAKQAPESTIVVGHQSGGYAALMALAAHPGRARGLVLIDTPLKFPLQLTEQQKKQFTLMLDQNYETMKPRLFAKMGRDSTQSEAIYAIVSQAPAGTVKAYFREALNADANKTIQALGMPVRLLVSDRVWKRDGSWTGVAHTLGWDDTTFVTPHRIVDSAFWVMKDQPDTLAAILAGFSAERVAAKK